MDLNDYILCAVDAAAARRARLLDRQDDEALRVLGPLLAANPACTGCGRRVREVLGEPPRPDGHHHDFVVG